MRKRRRRGHLYRDDPLQFLTATLGAEVVDVEPRSLPGYGPVWAARLAGGQTMVIAERFHTADPAQINAAIAAVGTAPASRPLGKLGARHVRAACISVAWHRNHPHLSKGTPT